jgi:hypothetical protein
MPHGRSVVTGVVVAVLAGALVPSANAEPVALPEPGRVVVFAGTGQAGAGGDGGPATRARFDQDVRIEADQAGGLYVMETYGAPLRRVTPDGVIDTVPGTPSDIGTGAVTVAPDGTVHATVDEQAVRYDENWQTTPLGPVTGPPNLGARANTDLAVDATGTVYRTDHQNQRILRIDRNGTVSTVAGGGTTPLAGADGLQATDVQQVDAARLAVTGDGTLYFIAGAGVYRIDHDGVLTTLTSEVDLSGGGLTGLAVDKDGTLFVATAAGEVLTAEPGADVLTRLGAFGVNDRTTNDLRMGMINDLTVGPDGDLYVAADAIVLRMIRHDEQAPATGARVASSRWAHDKPGTVHAVADATVPELGSETSLTVGVDGLCYGTDEKGRLFAVDRDGRLTYPAFGAAQRSLVTSREIAAGRDGSLYLGDTNTVTRRYPDGSYAVLAGSSAYFDMRAVSVGQDDRVYVSSADTVFRLSPNGKLDKIVTMGGITDMTVGPDDTVYLTGNNRVYVVRDGKPEPIAGTGEAASTEDDEDGGDALDATLAHPHQVAVTEDATVFVSTDEGLRRITPDGVIDTVPGTDRYTGGVALATGPDGDLYYLKGNADGPTVRIDALVRPAALAPPPSRFPWTATLLGAAALLVLGAATGFLLRRRRARK